MIFRFPRLLLTHHIGGKCQQSLVAPTMQLSVVQCIGVVPIRGDLLWNCEHKIKHTNERHKTHHRQEISFQSTLYKAFNKFKAKCSLQKKHGLLCGYHKSNNTCAVYDSLCMMGL